MSQEDSTINISTLGFIWWGTSLCLATIQGGFWWIFLNIFIPIAPFMPIAHFLSKL